MEETIKLNITTHSGEEDIVEVDEYNSADLAKSLNDIDVQSIAIGDHVYSRIDVKNVKPVPLETLAENDI